MGRSTGGNSPGSAASFCLCTSSRGVARGRRGAIQLEHVRYHLVFWQRAPLLFGALFCRDGSRAAMGLQKSAVEAALSKAVFTRHNFESQS